MGKLWQWLDNNILKFSVIGTLIFLTLYPKLPSIQVTHTWVYVRLEDFAIALICGIWLLQLLRRKVKLALPVGIPIIAYWIVGLVSLIYCLIFIAPHLANFFPKIAAFEYVRRIEYMILFFVAFSTIKSIKDVRDYLIGLVVALVGVILYGLGQHFYLDLWKQFPQFFEKYPFCFPAFETGNEEFAKGIPLCLPVGARATSTFGGHYDLAAYLVIVLPVLLGIMLAVKKWAYKIGLGVLYLGGLMLLIFTSSRTSFVTYLVGVIAALMFMGKKKLIIPAVVISIALLLTFSSSTAQRFLETIRFTSVVTNSQGQVVGVDQGSLPQSLQKKISKNPVVVSEEAPSQNLPTGSSFITLPQAPIATSVAVVKNKLDPKEAERLKLAYGGLEISTISGTFLIQKALVYDISFTTRFQAEWPRDFQAFLSSPVLGTGYSSLTLASDNDYLRALGETGILGLVSFLFIFAILGIFLKENNTQAHDRYTRFFALGLAGGVVGLFSNAILIDVFEASKVAEPLWILLGVAVGALALSQTHAPRYLFRLTQLLTTKIFLGIYLLLLTFVFFGKSVMNYFVADDFTWLHWSAQATTHDMAKFFTNAQGFFYRPIDRAVMLFLFTFFSFQPQGYHLFALFTHFGVSIALFALLMQLLGKKLWAFIGAFVFLVMPTHPENLFWISTLSTNLSTLFLILSVTTLVRFIKRNTWLSFAWSILFALLALFSYEMGVIIPLLALSVLFFVGKMRKVKQYILFLLPYILADGLYLLARAKANVAPVGGDYAYNLYHFIPNFVGNLLGYIAYFIGGDAVLPVYTLLREITKQYSLVVGAGFALVAAGVVVVLWVYRKRIKLVSYVWFGFLWIIIGLLPFLGLGNLSTRYGYFASIGFVIILVSLLEWVSHKTFFQKHKVAIVACIFVLVGLVSFIQINRQSGEWQHAGKITYSTLGFFKIEDPILPPGSVIFVVNTPIRQGNTWIFPVGLEDGLWFIYRQYLPPIIKEPSVEKAQADAAGYEHPYIFQFDKNGKISQVK